MSVTWSQWIRSNRKHKGMTGEQLAGEVGCTARTVSNWETGSIPMRQYREKLTELFGKMPDEDYAELISQYLREKGMSQRKFAALVGVEPHAVLRWVHRKTVPRKGHCRDEVMRVLGGIAE